MTFSTFGQMKERLLAETLRVGDVAFAAEMHGFFRLAEQRLWFGDESTPSMSRVRVRDMETSEILTFVDGAAAIPARFLEPIALVWGPAEPAYVAPSDFWRTRNVSTLYPDMYLIEGEVVRVSPAMSGQARMAYVRAYAPLSSDGDTNWLMINAPAAYFHAALIEAWRFLRNPEKMRESLALYRSAVAGLNRSEARARFTPTSLVQHRSVFA